MVHRIANHHASILIPCPREDTTTRTKTEQTRIHIFLAGLMVISLEPGSQLVTQTVHL